MLIVGSESVVEFSDAHFEGSWKISDFVRMGPSLVSDSENIHMAVTKR